MRKEKYLEMIVPLLKREGLQLSMDAIADSIGVSRKTLYNQFASKDELTAQCSKYLFGQFREMTGCLADENVPAQEGFRQGMMGLRDFFREASHVFTRDLMASYPGIAQESHNSGSQLFGILLKANIERGQNDGTYRKDVDSCLFSKYIAFSVMAFFQKEIMRGGNVTVDDYFNKVIDFTLQSLLVRN